MEKMKSYRPVKAAPRPESIRELSPFGEKLLMILQENRSRDNTTYYYGNSGTSAKRRFGNGDIMQELKKWGDSKENEQSIIPCADPKSFLKPSEAKHTTTVNRQVSSTETLNYNRRERPESSLISSTQSNTVNNLKRASMFAGDLTNKKICNKFQTPFCQSLTKNIPNRSFQDNISSPFMKQIGCGGRNYGHKTTLRNVGATEIHTGTPTKKTTQKTIGECFAAGSSGTGMHQRTKQNNHGTLSVIGEDRSIINYDKQSISDIKMTQRNEQVELKIRTNSAFSQSFAPFITFPDDDHDQISSVLSHGLDLNREKRTVMNEKNVESHYSGDESNDSFLVTVDDLIDATRNKFSDDDEDNYTVDMFADEEPKTTTNQKISETGMDKIRNKLMKFRRIEEDD